MHVHAILTVMTRKQVALRLGKSLATVRRIEGVLLHPTRDARGVHQFDDSEVEALARRVMDGHVQLSQEFSATNGETYDSEPREPCEKCAGLERGLPRCSRKSKNNGCCTISKFVSFNVNARSTK